MSDQEFDAQVGETEWSTQEPTSNGGDFFENDDFGEQQYSQFENNENNENQNEDSFVQFGQTSDADVGNSAGDGIETILSSPSARSVGSTGSNPTSPNVTLSGSGPNSPNIYQSSTNITDEELSFIAKSRLERQERLEQQKKQSLIKREEIKSASKSFKQQFIDERNHRVDAKKKINRDQEALLVKEKTESGENAWEDVLKFVDLSSQPNQEKDTSRLKKLLLTLKNKN